MQEEKRVSVDDVELTEEERILLKDVCHIIIMNEYTILYMMGIHVGTILYL
jgi:hypothetical protein